MAPAAAGSPKDQGSKRLLTNQNTFSSTAVLRQQIVVGCPKEVKPSEHRVGLTPSSAAEYVRNGHTVVVQKGAGEGAGFDDAKYEIVGCVLVSSAEEVYGASHMIVKVKEPIACEYGLIREGQVLFTYFHFAANRELTEAMIKRKAICIAYETVEAKDGSLCLLTPMSEIAGRMSIQEGQKFLEKPFGGRGVLISGVPGVKPAKIVVFGGGVVGINAAKMAAGTGADVTIMDINVPRLRYLDDVLARNCHTRYCDPESVKEELATADLVVGAVLVPGATTPRVISREHLKLMKKGSLIVDVAVDQGGCCETTRATTHENPTYCEEGILHYCVGNMPGAVPVTSTVALNNVTLRYGIELANKGWITACKENIELGKGLNIANGTILYKAVADAFGLSGESRDTFLSRYDEKKQQESMNALTTSLASIAVVGS